jgi:hypothetical protein
MSAFAVIIYLAPWAYGICAIERVAARRRTPVAWGDTAVVVVVTVLAIQAWLDLSSWFTGDALALSVNAMLVTAASRADPFPRARTIPKMRTGAW